MSPHKNFGAYLLALILVLLPIVGVVGGCNSSNPILPTETASIDVDPIKVTLYPRIWNVETTTKFSAIARREDGTVVTMEPLEFKWHINPVGANNKSLVDENGEFVCGVQMPAGLYLAWAEHEGTVSANIQIFVSNSSVYEE